MIFLASFGKTCAKSKAVDCSVQVAASIFVAVRRQIGAAAGQAQPQWSTRPNSDASGLRMIGNSACKNFLLRPSYCEENQGSLRFENKIHTFTDLEFRSYKTHFWSVRHDAEARILVLVVERKPLPSDR